MFINSKIKSYIKQNKNRSFYFKSLGRENYLSLLKFVDCVIGNSSSGIIEAPSFKTYTIDIGDRQKGRVRSKSVINVNSNVKEIIKAINKVKSNKKNPLTKLFIKLCRIFGFEIIDQSNFSIPTSKKRLSESLSIPGKKSITLPLGKVEITRPIRSLDIILRTCMSVNMLTQSKKRMFEKSKEEYTKRTLISITKSINHARNIFKNTKFVYI